MNAPAEYRAAALRRPGPSASASSTQSPPGTGGTAHRGQGSALPAIARGMIGLLAATMLLGACGKVGPVRAPGPADQVTYPRLYPNR